MNRYAMRVAAFIIGLFCAVPGWGTVRYATPTGGVATTPCSLAAPCTLDYLDGVLTVAGDIGYLLPGRYSEGINTGAAVVGGTVKFECSTGRAADCVIDGYVAGSTDRVIQMDSSNYILSKVTIVVPALGAAGTGSKYGVRMEASGSGNQVVDSVFYSSVDSDPTNKTNLQWAIQARGTNFYVARNNIRHVNVGINANTDSGAPTGIIEDNVISDLSQGDEEDADCLNVGSTVADSAYGLILRRNDCSGYRDDGIDLFGGTNVIVVDNRIHDSGQSTNSNSGIKLAGCTAGPLNGTGNIVERNWVYVKGGGTQNDYGMVLNGLSNGLLDSNIVVSDPGVPAIEMAECGVSPNGGGDNNSLTNNNLIGGNYGIYVRNTAAGNTAKNNIISGATADVNIESGVTLSGATNDKIGTGTAVGAGTYSSTGDITVSPQWAGGPTPTTIQGFRLKPTSPLKCAGTNVGRITDALGRGHEPNCTPIGAMVYGRGDARATALPARP